MRLDDHFGLKHADAQSHLLCRLKRAKQGISQEIGTHAAAVIADRKDSSAVALRCLDEDSAIRSNGITGIKKQVGYHTLQLLPIDDHLGNRLEILHQLDTWHTRSGS